MKPNYFRKVMCSDRLPDETEKYYMTNWGYVYLNNFKNWRMIRREQIDWWLEPVAEPLFTEAEMSKCWDAALAHALKLEGHRKSFEDFIKILL